MGRIKTKAVKRASTRLIARDADLFTPEFNHNKKVLGREMPSKKVRNMIAGYIARLRKHNKKIIQD
jgi:ribosomal protein S17E